MKNKTLGNKLATRIANHLFTPGGSGRWSTGEKAEHLGLTDKYGKYICGWAYDPAVNAIRRIIEDHINRSF